jgi:hypothetical protein
MTPERNLYLAFSLIAVTNRTVGIRHVEFDTEIDLHTCTNSVFSVVCKEIVKNVATL